MPIVIDVNYILLKMNRHGHGLLVSEMEVSHVILRITKLQVLVAKNRN